MATSNPKDDAIAQATAKVEATASDAETLAAQEAEAARVADEVDVAREAEAKAAVAAAAAEVTAAAEKVAAADKARGADLKDEAPVDLRAVYGLLIHPFDETKFDTGELGTKPHVIDGWVRTQLDAGKLVVA